MITENHKIVFLFSGQGSHYRGMGEFLYKNHAAFKKSLEKSDALVYRYLGQSLIEELYRKKEEPFDDLLITHPSIVAVELAILALMEELAIFPDFVAGSSLGEFSAASANGIWTKEAALEASVEQAKAVVQCGAEGGMLTVVGEFNSQVKSLLEENRLYLASENFPGHMTISGKKENLDNFERTLMAMNISYFRLPVKYPFHSPLIDSAKSEFMQYIYTARPCNKPSKGFISGLYGKEPDRQLPDDYFWKVARETADFSAAVQYLETQGPCIYVDLGPSGTTANFVKYNLPSDSQSVIYSIMTPYKRELLQLQALLNFVL